MPVAIDYKLTGTGWAQCTISNGEQSCTLTASYLSDALGNMILAAVALLRQFNALSFSFDEKPGEYRWVIASTRANEIELRILEFDDRYSHKPDAEGRLLLRAICIPESFAIAVHEAATKVLAQHGEEGYLATWCEYPFPTERLNELSLLLAQLRANA
jgi:hypothetical protein